uniref:Uncharacterized protein n=1 Tax=Magallana gigas TaxID=29159 RepID=K1RT53_MAGGI
MGCGQFSLIDHNEKFVSNCSEEHEDDSKRAREYSPSRHDLTRDYQQNTISLKEKKALSVVIAVGSEHFQSIRKGICSQPIFRKNYRVHAILTILLPFQVNQEVLPQYSVSWRISSPLTTSKRVPYH